jgi:hypothetical protein
MLDSGAPMVEGTQTVRCCLSAQVITHDSGQSNAQGLFVRTRPRSPAFDRGWQYHLADESVWMCTWFGGAVLPPVEKPFKFPSTMGHATSEKRGQVNFFSRIFLPLLIFFFVDQGVVTPTASYKQTPNRQLRSLAAPTVKRNRLSNRIEPNWVVIKRAIFNARKQPN